ncbi:MAG: glycerol-3-phosphate dehydrogenase/oxidase [Chitinophagaceae bacterium]|nr:glycerol-3-phosphate dehydrogenase/oxidase [Chitinophagaceae bacterium]
MNRESMLRQLQQTSQWDILIIGGGATGLGAAVDAASRGYKTLLIEQHDFGKGTSSRSTKLVHGGVRYLEQGNLKLVKEALRERGYLLRNAPHLTRVQPFILPLYSWWQKWYYAVGLKLYDLLAGKLSLGKTRVLSKKETLERLASVQQDRLAGSVLYFDGQFDDSRLCIDLAITATRQGGTLLNYCAATGFEKNAKKKINAVKLVDTLTGTNYTVSVKAVINATGVFTDAVLQMDDHIKHEIVSPSQGIHLVIERQLFPGTDAMIIPKTDDGRVLFAVPWHEHVILGTTDTPVETVSTEPKPLEEEIEFILAHINRYSTIPVSRSDVKTVFAGLRPLVRVSGPKRTALLSRDHTLIVSPSGLVTITGGKWTTYRKMAADAVDNAVFVTKQEKRDCLTKDLAIGNRVERQSRLEVIIRNSIDADKPLHAGFEYRWADVLYAIRFEMAQSIEDILARRTRILFLDAKLAVTLAPAVSHLLMSELGKDEQWRQDQLLSFETLAKQYILA